MKRRNFVQSISAALAMFATGCLFPHKTAAFSDSQLMALVRRTRPKKFATAPELDEAIEEAFRVCAEQRNMLIITTWPKFWSGSHLEEAICIFREESLRDTWNGENWDTTGVVVEPCMDEDFQYLLKAWIRVPR